MDSPFPLGDQGESNRQLSSHIALAHTVFAYAGDQPKKKHLKQEFRELTMDTNSDF